MLMYATELSPLEDHLVSDPIESYLIIYDKIASGTSAFARLRVSRGPVFSITIKGDMARVSRPLHIHGRWPLPSSFLLSTPNLSSRMKFSRGRSYSAPEADQVFVKG